MGDSTRGSYCTPTKHPFNGRVVALQSEPPRAVGDHDIITGSYCLEYEFEPFVDAKYPGRSVSPRPTWARISFAITCPCGQTSERSTQTNIVRPWTVRCQCGQTLFVEDQPVPIFSDAVA
jgi:hypothetical protein